MKIRVTHKETEVIIEDDGQRTDTNYNLISNNQKYLLELLTKIADEIIRIKNENGGKNE
jgi:transcriptional regulator of NAD metabolism